MRVSLQRRFAALARSRPKLVLTDVPQLWVYHKRALLGVVLAYGR